MEVVMVRIVVGVDCLKSGFDGIQDSNLPEIVPIGFRSSASCSTPESLNV